MRSVSWGYEHRIKEIKLSCYDPEIDFNYISWSYNVAIINYASQINTHWLWL